MNELIKVTTSDEGKQLVSARELHEFLEVTERFQQWFEKKVEKYGFIENEDFTGCKIFNTLAKQELQDYAITLDMGKELSMVQNNEKGKSARKYFIQCEKVAKENVLNTSKLSPELQMFKQIFDSVARQQLEQQQIKNEIAATKEEIQGIRDVVAINSMDWKDDCKSLVVKIANSLGGISYIQDVYREVYSTLEKRMGVQLSIRLTNKRRRMADEGVCKSKRDRLNNISVIGDDKKLIEGYVAIIKELAIKYKVA